MSIKLEVHFGSFEELAEFASRQVGASAPLRAAKATLPPAPKPVAAPKQEPEKTPESADALDDTGEENSDGIEVPENPTFDDVKRAVLKVNKNKGKTAAIGVLKKFGAEKVGPQLQEKDYGAVIKECNSVLTAE